MKGSDNKYKLNINSQNLKLRIHIWKLNQNYTDLRKENKTQFTKILYSILALAEALRSWLLKSLQRTLKKVIKFALLSHTHTYVHLHTHTPTDMGHTQPNARKKIRKFAPMPYNSALDYFYQILWNSRKNIILKILLWFEPFPLQITWNISQCYYKYNSCWFIPLVKYS